MKARIHLGPAALFGLAGTVAVHAAVLLAAAGGAGDFGGAGHAAASRDAEGRSGNTRSPAAIAVQLMNAPPVSVSTSLAPPVRLDAVAAYSDKARPSQAHGPAMSTPASDAPSLSQSPSPSASATSTDDPLDFREPWDVEEVAAFLHPPARLAELLETADLPLQARITVYVDAQGTLVRIHLDGAFDDDLAAALRDALQEASFLPARISGMAVPSIKRFEVGSTTLEQRMIVRADAQPDPAGRDGPAIGTAR